MTPMQKSLELLRAEGYTPFIVEYWDAFARRRKDLCGIGDILALRENEVLIVQTTSHSNVWARVRKITDHENTPHIRKAGIRIEVHGWGKKREGRRYLWDLKRREDLS